MKINLRFVPPPPLQEYPWNKVNKPSGVIANTPLPVSKKLDYTKVKMNSRFVSPLLLHECPQITVNKPSGVVANSPLPIVE